MKAVNRSRYGIIGSPVVIILFLGVTMLFTGMSYAECIISDCGPDSSNVAEEVSIQSRTVTAAGMANQLLYTTRIGEQHSLLDALELYAHCVEGPAAARNPYCEDAPSTEDITAAIESYAETWDALGGYPTEYEVEVEKDGTNILDVSAGEPPGKPDERSLFIYHHPIPGGEHIKIAIAVRRGGMSMGVISE